MDDAFGHLFFLRSELNSRGSSFLGRQILFLNYSLFSHPVRNKTQTRRTYSALNYILLILTYLFLSYICIVSVISNGIIFSPSYAFLTSLFSGHCRGEFGNLFLCAGLASANFSCGANRGKS